MKRALAILALLLVANVAAPTDAPSTAPATAPAVAAPPAAAPDLAVYASDTVHVRFRYPASLIKTDAPDPNAVVMFRHNSAPLGEIHLQVNSSGKSLPDSALSQVADGMVDLVKRQHGTVVSRSDTTLGSAPAVKLVFSFAGTIKTVNMCNVTAIYDGKIYGLVASAPADQFDKFLALVQPMYDSFQLTGPVKK